MASLEAGILLFAVGIILVIISKSVTIEATVTKIMWIIGIILLVLGLMVLLLWGLQMTL